MVSDRWRPIRWTDAFRELVFLWWSVAVHAIILAAIAVLGLWGILSAAPGVSGGHIEIGGPVEIMSMDLELAGADYVVVDDYDGTVNLRWFMRQVEQRIEGLSEEELWEELRVQLRRVEGVPPEDVASIAAAVERLKGVSGERQYAPKEGAKGSFDVDSASLYDIRRLVREDGSVAYVLILVDRAGRQMLHVVEEEDMSEADLTAFRLFEMGRANPSLRRLIDAARKLHAAERERPAPPADGGEE